MVSPVSLPVRLLAAMLLSALLLTPCRPVAAQAKPISQTRINEYAAVLLKVHRALIENLGLRRPDEQLGQYIERLVAPLPGESQEARLARHHKYIEAFKSLTDTRNLCTAVPNLRDKSPANFDKWQKVTQSSAQLPGRYLAMVSMGKVLVPHSEAEKYDGQFRDHDLAREITRTLLEIKIAFEALREARP